VERVFRLLQKCSPATGLVDTEMDLYVLIWLTIAAVLTAASWWQYPHVCVSLQVVLIAAAVLRVADITQLVVNLALFDRLGQGAALQHVQVVQDVTRSLVLLLWNFVELTIWFGLAYVAAPFSQRDVSFGGRFYFSAITQLTIGYGDLTPLQWTRVVAAAQGVLGWFLTVLVIARLVSSLPRLEALAPVSGGSARGAAQQGVEADEAR
jgi:Ion channel